MALQYLPTANVVVLATVVQAGGALDFDRDRQRGNVYVSIVVQTDDLLIVPGCSRKRPESLCNLRLVRGCLPG